MECHNYTKQTEIVPDSNIPMRQTMRTPYLLFLADAPDATWVKTAAGIHQWRRELCAGQLRLPGCGVDLRLPELTLEQAATRGIGTMIIGVANDGGFIAPNWIDTIVRALEAGLDVASGLHDRLADVPEIAEAANRTGRALIEVRQPSQSFAPGTGRKRSGKRLLTVGTDCAVGKKYTALAIEQELRKRGVIADFRATGQTGIFISGRGVAIDSVISDFVSGAAEWLSPDAPPDHWDVIEGQGSLFHPAYAGVTLGLIHGSQPDLMVLCHDDSRSSLLGFENFAIAPYEYCLTGYLAAASLTNKNVRFVGVSLNTSQLNPLEAERRLASVSERLSLPCCDPIRSGVGAIVDHVLALA